jgi:hypothetical protein
MLVQYTVYMVIHLSTYSSELGERVNYRTREKKTKCSSGDFIAYERRDLVSKEYVLAQE